jgi:hypothetical protein
LAAKSPKNLCESMLPLLCGGLPEEFIEQAGTMGGSTVVDG